MRAVLADTGPVYALKDPDDQFHERAREESLRLEREQLSVLIAYPVLFEAYNLILRRMTLEDAHRWLREAASGATFTNPTQGDYQQAIEWTRRYPDQSISLVDAVLAVLSDHLDVPVWTYDHHFDTVKARIWR